LDTKPLIVEKRGTCTEITIHRPQALNVLNRAVLEELTQAFVELEGDSIQRTVILVGAGEKAFVAGADIAGMVDLDDATALEFAQLGHGLADLMGRVPQVVIAAVHGFALGGGCELALACDFIYASEKAKFGQPEVKLAVIPGFGGTQRLARRVGLAKAMEMITVGEPIDAAEALRTGLVAAVVPGGRDEVLAYARAQADRIAERAPIAVALAKRAVRMTQEVPLAAGNSHEAEAFARCFATADQKEGMRAFLEKRKATFTGR
jgi:enoyl-CoA hydratase